MRKPIYTDEQIIQAGEALMAKLGREVSATDIHKALDGKGKFSRIREIWEAHQATRDEADQTEIPLPDEAQAQLEATVATLEQSLEVIVKQVIARMTEQQLRQASLRDRDFALLEAEHMKKIQKLEEEVAYLEECVDEMQAQAEAEADVIENEGPELEQPSPQEQAPVAAAPRAARKSPNPRVKKTDRTPRKTSRPRCPAPTK